MDSQYKRTLDRGPLNPTVTFLESSSKNIKLVKFLSHRKYLPTPCSARTSTSLTPFQPLVCLFMCVYVKERKPLRAITAVYSRDFSHGNLVYLLYLQYNASVNISNFETQVSISRLAAVRACSSCVCSARCREEMNTAAKERRRGFKNRGHRQRGPKIIQNKNGQRG